MLQWLVHLNCIGTPAVHVPAKRSIQAIDFKIGLASHKMTTETVLGSVSANGREQETETNVPINTVYNSERLKVTGSPANIFQTARFGCVNRTKIKKNKNKSHTEPI